MLTSYTEILQKIDLIKPVQYSKNRNFIDGDVSKLSPYISRGVISTLQVFKHIITKLECFFILTSPSDFVFVVLVHSLAS